MEVFDMLSEKELQILTHLRKNGRETLTKLSKKTGIPISTIHDLLKSKYEDVIEKYATLVDFTKLGFGNRAYIILRVNKSERSEILEFLLRQEFVNSLYKINNGYDFLVEGIFRGIRDLESFTERLDEKFDVREIKIYHVLDDIKREEFLNAPESLYLLQPDERTTPWHDNKTQETANIKQDSDKEEEPEEHGEKKGKTWRKKQGQV